MAPSPAAPEPRPASAADLLLRALKAHGIEFFFCNPGTDFPPIVEAFARARKSETPAPRPFVVPHENTAVSIDRKSTRLNSSHH